MRSSFRSIAAVAAATFLVLGLLAAAPPARADYPERPITLIVPWGAGGGTDATARIVGSLLSEELGQPVNVVNRTGGSGVVGHTAIAQGEPDGYTLGMATVEIGMMHWQRLTELTGADYTPLALMNVDPAAVQVGADASYDGIQDLFAAVKAAPGSLKASGTGQGGIWHVALAGLLADQGLEVGAVPWVPSQGAAPGLQDLLAGGVEIVACSLPEARSLIDAGRVKSLGIMAAERNPVFPDVPTMKEQIGTDWELGAWRGIVGPPGLPEAVSQRLIQALDAIYRSEEYKTFMNQRGFGMEYAAGPEFAAFMAASDGKLGAVMKELGLARTD
jgi:tripartite-type tricarboxylate transporter receptor subunit TctC